MPRLRKTFKLYLIKAPDTEAGKIAIAKQYAMGLLAICLGIVLSLPLVPGPGFILILLGALILRVPGSVQIIKYLNNKKGFQRFKLWLKLKTNVEIITQ